MQKVSERGLASGKLPTSDLLSGVAMAHCRPTSQDSCSTGQTLCVLGDLGVRLLTLQPVQGEEGRVYRPGTKGSAINLL